MSRQKPLQIHIPQPCSQNWEDMEMRSSGRHCDHCQKTVIDFTEWSDAALHVFFSKNKEHVCGQLAFYQLNRPLSIPSQPHSRLYRIAVALGLTLLATQAQMVQARPRPPLTEQSPLIDAPDTTYRNAASMFAGIAGNVVDEKNKPVRFASIQVYRDTVLVATELADSSGNYKIEPLAPGKYNIEVQRRGHKSVTKTDVAVTQRNTRVDFVMDKKDTDFIRGDIWVY